MRSIAGVGMTPPNVPETPYPWSSVMIRSTLGAPLGGTTRAGQYGFDWLAWRLISPPNFGGGGGRDFPSIGVVAPGEPGVRVIFCAAAGRSDTAAMATLASSPSRMLLIVLMVPSV